jgi:hypothetical protein
VARFASVVIYTCKAFDPAVAVETTRSFFAMTAIESQSF